MTFRKDLFILPILVTAAITFIRIRGRGGLCDENVIRLPVGGYRGIGQQILLGFNSKNSTECKALLCNVNTEAIRTTMCLLAVEICVM